MTDRDPGRGVQHLMHGKTVLITGSTAGIGRQTALELADRGATVIVHGRNAARGSAVLTAVQAAMAASGAAGQAALLLADLSSVQSVRGLAAQVRALCPRLDVLVNNAGVYAPRRVATTDGVELTFAVNVLAPFVLTHALLPLLQASSPARIVNLSSTSHWTGSMHWDDLQLERGYDPLVAYEQSKLAMTLYTLALARRLEGSGVTAVCLDPGNVDTDMLRAGWPELAGVDLAEGAQTSVRLATDPGLAGVNGVYFEGGRPTTPPPASLDLTAQERLWRALEQCTQG